LPLSRGAVTLFGMAELPSGAITFLFTDIEGSTRLVKHLRDRYGEVLAEHQRLLRAAFEAHGGYEVDTQGDSFFVAFTSAREALLAAVEGQLALLTHSWPDGVEVKVRMGLHTGQAVATGDRYTGLAVHRAARIGAAGHGGQVLVSQATQTLLEDEEEDLHVFFRDLGEQRLKDLDRPVRLYQAAANGLPASFPPIRREAELAQAAEAAIRVPVWRRPVALAAAALGLVVVVAAGAFIATRDSPGGLGGVRPNHVGLIDPETNEIVAEVQVGIRPGPIDAVGGSVWVGNLQDRNLTRIDAQQRSAAATISLENRTPTGIAVGAGAVWVAHGARGELSRVDPQFGQVTNTIEVTGTGLGTQSAAVTIGAGSVWAVYADSTMARIDPTDIRVVGTTFAGSAPAGVVVASGSVWVANSGEATVSRFNPSTFEEGPLRSPSVGRRPLGVAFGEGAIWVANAGDDAVTRIDPSTYATTTIPVGDEPVAIAVGERAVWVASAGAATVSRIDPATNEVAETIDVGNAPSGIAVGDGSVWVSVQAP
jgi:YVTN family beta-propeller protein